MSEKTGFLGTYFDRDKVLKLDRLARWIGWAVLAAYALEAGYTVFNSVYSSIISAYQPDWFFLFISLSRILQGAVLCIFLHLGGQAMLILLDIEDNTRRAARTNLPKA